jgi:hypothetical protein
MRVKLFRAIGVLMLVAVPISASSDEVQQMTVAQLLDKCTSADQNSAAFCDGLANGVLNQLQANGLYLNMATLRVGVISEDTRKVLKSAGAVCGAVEPKMALMAFISWGGFTWSLAVITALLALRPPSRKHGRVKNDVQLETRSKAWRGHRLPSGLLRRSQQVRQWMLLDGVPKVPSSPKIESSSPKAARGTPCPEKFGFRKI